MNKIEQNQPIQSQPIEQNQQTVINEIVYGLLDFNYTNRSNFNFDDKMSSKDDVRRDLINTYNFFADSVDKNTIINNMLTNYKVARNIFHSKDEQLLSNINGTTYRTNRLNSLINLLTFVIGQLDLIQAESLEEEESKKLKIKYIFFAMEYIIALQIFSDGNHRTSAYLVELLLKKYIDEITQNKFTRWYTENFQNLNSDENFNHISIILNREYNFIVSPNELFSHSNSNIEQLITQFIEYNFIQTDSSTNSPRSPT